MAEPGVARRNGYDFEAYYLSSVIVAQRSASPPYQTPNSLPRLKFSSSLQKFSL
jgi:hypothetical protein